jgi:hypothetical protein
MSERREWFAPKRYGYGAGMPITWQGWALTLLSISITIALMFAFARKPLLLWATLLPLVLLFVLIAARTTRGGWRWRWGERD